MNRASRFLQRLGDLFNVTMTFVDSFDIAMILLLDVRRFVWCRNDRRAWCLPICSTYLWLSCMMFDDSFDVVMTFVLDIILFVWRSDDRLPFVRPSCLCTRRIRLKYVILRVLFSNDLNVPIGPSCGSVFWVSPRSYFDITYVIQRPNLTSDCLFDEKYYNRV